MQYCYWLCYILRTVKECHFIPSLIHAFLPIIPVCLQSSPYYACILLDHYKVSYYIELT